jgi:DNA replication protein DnaC
LNVNLEIDTSDKYIASMLKELKMADIRKQYNDLINAATEKQLGYREFLAVLLKTEESGRKKRRTQKCIRNANFEKLMTLEEYDYGFHKYANMQKIKELSTLNFIGKNENIILVGKPGSGKTHIATGIGLLACEAGKKVLFENALDLINNMLRAAREGRLMEALMKLSKIDLIIVDELGYLKMDKERESVFFQLIRSRYEKKSTIITSNFNLGQWDEIFSSQLAATAILDRLIHHCHIILMGDETMGDDSYRVKGKREGLS